MANMNRALEDYNEAIHLKPDFIDAYINRGVLKMFLGKHNKAIVDFDTAIRLKSNDIEAYINRGNANFSLGSI